MILKSFGCSFIFGSELADDQSHIAYSLDPNDINVSPSQLTWPALLAQEYNCRYECYALPGIGNLQIFERLLNQLQSSQEEEFTVIVGWSWIDRFDYVNQFRGKFDNFWKTIRPAEANLISEYYFKNIHSQYSDKLNTLIYIKTAIDCLKEKNIPFIMTYCDDLIFEEEWHTSPAINILQNYVKPYLFNFNGMSFLDWSKINGYPISPNYHPLEQAHQAAFELIKSYNLV